MQAGKQNRQIERASRQNRQTDVHAPATDTMWVKAAGGCAQACHCRLSSTGSAKSGRCCTQPQRLCRPKTVVVVAVLLLLLLVTMPRSHLMSEQRGAGAAGILVRMDARHHPTLAQAPEPANKQPIADATISCRGCGTKAWRCQTCYTRRAGIGVDYERQSNGKGQMQHMRHIGITLHIGILHRAHYIYVY